MSETTNDQKNKSTYPAQTDGVSNIGNNQNSSDAQGDTSDVDNDSLTTGRIAATERSAASSSKTNVTGSDLDGQTSF